MPLMPLSVIDAAAIDRRLWPDDPATHLNLLVANGRCGGCFDAWGLQHADDPGLSRRTSRTVLTHAEVFHHGRHGLDGVVPLGQLRWDRALGEPQRWSQRQDFASGCLTTRWQGDGLNYSLRVAADPQRRDLLVLEWRWTAGASATVPAMVLAAVASHDSDHGGTLIPMADAQAADRRGALGCTIGSARGHVAMALSGDLALTADGQRLRISACGASGSGRIHLALGPSARSAELDELAATAAGETDPFATIAAGWRSRFGDAWIQAGDAEVQRRWVRLHAQVLASYAPDARCPLPPMGCSGNAWGFHFPQDLSYIHPALLRLGHLDIVRAHVGFYQSRIAAMERMTRRVYGRDGTMWAWEFPIGDGDDLFADGPAPNHFHHEIHNAAYPARMAYEAALLSDAQWSRDIAWPVVEASARFFADALAKGPDGRWGIHLIPSMGQDEYGGEDAPDYLCSLFAAEYTLTKALDLAARLGLGHPQAARWRAVLADGLAYDRLLQPHGCYASNRLARDGVQKHPVQLNPLTFLPLGRIDTPTRSAWRRRRQLCAVERAGMRHEGMRGSFYDGWTLPAFLLAAARMGDADAVEREWSELLPAQNVDRERITICESCGFWQPYYTTSMGLVMQAIHESLASDWLGPVRTATAWPRAWGRGSFHNFRFLDGSVRSGAVG